MGSGEKQLGTSSPSGQKKKVKLNRMTSLQLVTSSVPKNIKYQTTPSLLLTRWVRAAGYPQAPEPEADDSWTPEDSLEYGSPPPIEEPHWHSMTYSESSFIEDGKCAIRVCRDTVKTLVTEHARGVGVRLQLLEGLELGRITAENMKHVLETCSLAEINALMLYASFLGRGDLLPSFLDVRADLNHAEPEQGLTALHLCAYSNSLDGVKFLIRNGANITSRKIYTPFQYAAFGNSYEVARLFLVERIPQENPGGDETVLHCAARTNALDVLRLIAPNNPSLNSLDCAGFAPIHYVTDREHPGCLAELLKAGCSVDVTTRKGDTALHLAAEAGCAENLEILLEKGADPALKNHRAQTALHLAARAHSLESVEVLLRVGRSDPNAEDDDGRTPLHVALGRSTLAFDVSEFLVGWKANVNKADKYGYTPLHVAALNELSQCVDILIQHGADLTARTKGGTTALSIILRKTPTSLNVFKQRLDTSIALRQHGSATGEVELRLDFHPLLQHGQQGEIRYLNTFVEEGYKEILEHPLCQAFLHLKWQKIRRYYFGRLIFYLLYVLVLTAWVMTAFAHNCYNEDKLSELKSTNDSGLCGDPTIVYEFLNRYPAILDIEWYILTILTIFEAIRKLADISNFICIVQFFTQVDNLVEWAVVISVLATSFVYTGETYGWQNHVGAYAVLCGWANLMLMIGQLPMFGAYVAMFTSIQAQVFKLLMAYACLLVGFTASFCVMFPKSKSFSSPHTGLIKVLVMMTGEVDFEDLFFPSDDDSPDVIGSKGISWFLLQVSSQLCFLIFLLFVTIVLMNLLVGIAVHDIKGLQKTAGLAKLVRQTKLICETETDLFLGLLPRRLIKMLRWSALVLPSSMRVVLTVRPLNPREKRLPSEVLAAAHKIARDRKSTPISGAICGNRASISTAYTYLNSDARSTLRRGVPIEDDEDDDVDNRDTGEDAEGGGVDNDNLQLEQLREEILELKKVCNQNQKLIQDLVMALAMDERRYPDQAQKRNF
ncbi:transient receptor potential channel pyrexia [Athalia rosae]|uniref:transient receptor potential channel pyrexia n=1 Tax=Athalia rosae TaxID=37344 RepID=UPI00203422C6|nr:transient receptor potential channel pyrexia [Athalia rosae]XP_048512343.1 transient receptor potential channel pyrexia [Athalia rosae]